MKRGLPSIALFVLVICEDNSELTIGDSGGVGDRSARVSREYRVEYDTDGPQGVTIGSIDRFGDE